jgi:hypothetical protein
MNNNGPGSIQLNSEIRLDAEFNRSRDIVDIWVKFIRKDGSGKRGVKIRISEEFLRQHAEEVPPGGEYAEEPLMALERDSRLTGYKYKP